MERIYEIAPAWDKRSSDPSKNYGVHSVEIRMILKGELGATQFAFSTGWYLPEVMAEGRIKQRPPMGVDVGYHSPHPQYEGQEVLMEDCPYLDGKPCYYKGSGLQADTLLDTMIRKGGDAVWEELESRYRELFGELQ